MCDGLVDGEAVVEPSSITISYSSASAIWAQNSGGARARRGLTTTRQSRGLELKFSSFALHDLTFDLSL